MRDREARAWEEKKLLYQVFVSDATTTEERICGIRDVQFVEKCLELMKVKSLLPFGARGRGPKGFHTILSSMMEKEIEERYLLDLVPKIPVRVSEIDTVEYAWKFTHTLKTNTGSVRKNYQTQLVASTEEMALYLLEKKLIKQKRTLVSIQNTYKEIEYIVTKDCRVLQPYMIELIED